MKLLRRNMMAAAAEKLETIRTQLNFSCNKMATQLGITSSAYFKNENGESYPGWTTLNNLQKHHGISMDWFLFDRGPMYLNDKDNDAQRIKQLEDELLKSNTAKEEMEKALMDKTVENDELKEKLLTALETAKKQSKFLNLEGVEPELSEMVSCMNEDKRIRFRILSFFYEYKNKLTGETEE